jgi:C4-dicarboxylate transporter, DctQ subunit
MCLKLLDHLEEWLITLLIGSATLVIFVAVVHRYLCGIPYPPMQDVLLKINLGWAQELCIYMFVWMAKFGAAYGVRTGIHVGVDVLINQLKNRARDKFISFGLIAGAVFTSIVGTLGSRFVWHIAHTDQASPELEIPIWIAYLAIPCGSFLMCFRFLQVLVSFLRTHELPHHDHSHVDGIEEGDGQAEIRSALNDHLQQHDMAQQQPGENGTGGKRK